jgi:hypothetical protein
VADAWIVQAVLKGTFQLIERPLAFMLLDECRRNVEGLHDTYPYVVQAPPSLTYLSR